MLKTRNMTEIFVLCNALNVLFTNIKDMLLTVQLFDDLSLSLKDHFKHSIIKYSWKNNKYDLTRYYSIKCTYI